MLFVTEGDDAATEEVQRVKEHAIYKLGQLYIQYGYCLIDRVGSRCAATD